METRETFVHPQGIVDPGASVGAGTRVWAWAHVLAGARVGEDCNLCDHTFVEGKAVVGNRVTVKCNVAVWDGAPPEDDVFAGPSVAFTNDKFPRSRQWPAEYGKTRVRKGASIGANATILPVEIGEHAMVGAGAVVTKNIPAYAIVVGNPARIVGYVGASNVETGPAGATAGPVRGATGASVLDVPHFGDVRGDLNVLEFGTFLPFPVRRMFYTYNVGSTDVRGEHAHKSCEQFLVAVRGALNVIVDDGERREEFVLDSPSRGLHLPAGRWGIQYKHSADCVLLVLASHAYDESDYIRDYGEFIKWKKSV